MELYKSEFELWDFSSSYLTFDCGHERLLEVPDRSLATFVKLHNGLVHRDLEVVLVELLQELQVSD